MKYAVVVAPLAGAWIEIQPRLHLVPDVASLPSRERGLKSNLPIMICLHKCRSPRGSVD